MSDGKKQNTNESSKILFSAAGIAGVLILLSFIIFTFVSGKEIRSNNLQYLINDTQQSATNVQYAIEEGYNNILMFSSLMSDSLTSPEVNISNYQRLIKNSVFDYMEFADKDGMDHNITGGVSDAKDRKYYLDAMQGNSGMEVIFNSRATHENLMMFYAPVYYDGEIIGSLIGVYQASHRLAGLMELDYFGDKAASYLCTQEGKVFAGIADGDTSLEVYIDDVIDADEKVKNAITSAVKAGKSATFSTKGGSDDCYVMRVPDTEWMFVRVYPSAVSAKMIAKTVAVGLALVVVLLCIFLVFMAVVYRINKKQQQEIENALSEIKKAKETEESQLEILESMADIYYSMHLINLEDNSQVEYHSQNQVKDVVEKGTGITAEVIMNQVMYATMSDAFLDIGLAFSDVNTLQERMKGKKFISMDLLGKNVGWIRMSFITIEADTDGVPKRVICTTQIIDDEKKKEEKLLRESNTDELTGCYNRRAYEEDLRIYPDVPPEEDYVYVAMDLNGLKVVNDSLGHEAGDELIVGATKCMRRCLGNYGKVYRTGGDEFVAMIFANQQTLKDIQEDFEEAQSSWQGELVPGLSISTGYVAKREFPDKTVTEIVQIADQRMYEAKAKYYKTKGVDRRGQAAAHTALCAQYTKILKINLSDDSYQIVNMNVNEQTEEMGFAGSISAWLNEFAKSGQVHEEDIEGYLKKTDASYLSAYFKSGKAFIDIYYRRKMDDSYKAAVMELIPADDYTDENQSLFLYVKYLDR